DHLSAAKTTRQAHATTDKPAADRRRSVSRLWSVVTPRSYVRSDQAGRPAVFSNARRILGQYSREISSQPRKPDRVIRQSSGPRTRMARRRGSIKGDATRES